MKPGSRGALGAGAVCLCKVAEIRFPREHLLSALRTSGAGRVSSPCHPAPARGRRATSFKSLPCVEPGIHPSRRLHCNPGRGCGHAARQGQLLHIWGQVLNAAGPCASLRLGVITGTSPYADGNSLSAPITRQRERVFQQTHRLPWPRSEMPLKRQHRCPGSAGLLQPNRRKPRALLRPLQPEERARYADYQMLAVGRGA